MSQQSVSTTIMHISLTVASTVFAGVALFLAVKLSTEERNARLVEIGVGILRVDPGKETVVAPAREWALNLIDANAGGLKFSPEARRQLLGQPLAIQVSPAIMQQLEEDIRSLKALKLVQ